jgi:CheY-like chemotaxis protein
MRKSQAEREKHERHGKWQVGTQEKSRSSILETLTNWTAFLINESPKYVLVVEDEPFSRLYAVDLVESAGYKAVQAANADEAIAILEARKDISVVFTDIDMPGSMDGLKLAHAIRNRWPPIELILTSGHININEDELPERGRFFAKPYRDQEVISLLRHFAA